MLRPWRVRAVFLVCLWLWQGGLHVRAGVWPKVDTDLPSHPALREGTLPNGLRYVILPNAEPKERVSLRLVVAVGSLHEQDDERGLAHFVEHMVFRGTRTHPAGSLLEALQRLGIGAGPDVAAFTFLDHTIYHLELPDRTESTLREGLRTFREFGSEATFEPELLERERGVILSEQATRDTPGARLVEANLHFLWPRSRPARRRVGGLDASIRQFTRAQFVSFYDAWYRPERMAVVVVGAIDAAQIEALLHAELGSLAPRGEPRPAPDDLIPATTPGPDVAIHADPGLAGVQIVLERPFARPPMRNDHARRVELLREALAFAMFHQRLQRLAHEPGATFISPAAQLATIVPWWQVATVGAAGKNADWQQVASDLEQEHRRAFQFGFTQRELELARLAFARQYEEAVRTSPTWPSSGLATQLASSVLYGMNYVRPEELQRDLAADLAATTRADCLRAFRQAWTTAAPSVFIAANPSFRITRQQIANALNASRQRDVTPLPEADVAKFAYADFGPPGRLVHEEHLEDLDVRLGAFANEVRLNFKALPFEAGTVQVHVRVGDGKLSQRESRPGLDYLANFAVTAGGLGRHTREELTSLLAGQSLSLALQIESDACVFQARCAQRDLKLCLQIIAAFLTDAGYRSETMRDARANFGTMYTQLAASPGGVLSLVALRDLAGGDRRFGTPRGDELLSRDLDDLKAWLEPQFKHGPIELSIVGDTTWSEASGAVAETLAALPRRPPPQRKIDRTLVPPKPPANVKLLPSDPQVHQCAVAWYWPCGPMLDVHLERRCRLLAAVLHERCRVRLREELGAAYSPVASFNDAPGFPNLAHFVVYAEVSPDHVRQAMEIVQREAQMLARKGVPADDFARVKPPFLREREDHLRQLSYWGNTVLATAQSDPEHLAAARDRSSDSAAITLQEVSALAARFLEPPRSFRFLTVPQRAPATSRSSDSKSAAGTAGQAP